jgi:hypothetical protein
MVSLPHSRRTGESRLRAVRPLRHPITCLVPKVSAISGAAGCPFFCRGVVALPSTSFQNPPSAAVYRDVFIYGPLLLGSLRGSRPIDVNGSPIIPSVLDDDESPACILVSVFRLQRYSGGFNDKERGAAPEWLFPGWLEDEVEHEQAEQHQVNHGCEP